ncbi:MAG: right-handed parallel beta-helix repeat-containing protein [Lentisphaeria bacterium]|nr:right-handed parallel beta-helix repeat-containing protein [Lentisphaeria bacterium]
MGMRMVSAGGRIDVAEVGDLQTALDQLPLTGGTVWLPAGVYEIDETVRCQLAEGQHLNLCGEGRATVIRYTATDGSPFLEIRGVEGSWWPDLRITIRDLSLAGNHACGDALLLQWPNDALVDACFFEGFGGTAIRVNPQATNVTIRDCWMRDCHRALHADNLHHLTFHGNQTRSLKDGQTQGEHVYIGKHCREVRIVNNHLAYGHAEGIVLDGTAQHVVANNTIEGFTCGIRAIDCRDITISSNYLHCPTGIRLEEDNRGLVVTGNIFTNNHDGGAVMIRDARGSGCHVISNNIIRQSVYNDGQYGVDLGDAQACVVQGNIFEDLSGETAVRTEHEDCEVTGNVTTSTARRAEASLHEKGCPKPPSEKSAYRSLHEYLAELETDCQRHTMAWGTICRLLAEQDYADACSDGGWWMNDPSKPQAAAWLAAGWLAVIVKRIEGRVVFARRGGTRG